MAVSILTNSPLPEDITNSILADVHKFNLNHSLTNCVTTTQPSAFERYIIKVSEKETPVDIVTFTQDLRRLFGIPDLTVYIDNYYAWITVVIKFGSTGHFIMWYDYVDFPDKATFLIEGRYASDNKTIDIIRFYHTNNHTSGTFTTPFDCDEDEFSLHYIGFRFLSQVMTGTSMYITDTSNPIVRPPQSSWTDPDTICQVINSITVNMDWT